MKTNNLTIALSSVGALAGLAYAFKKEKSFWGYVGFFALGSVAGHLIGNVASAAIPNSKIVKEKSIPPVFSLSINDKETNI